MTMTGVIPSWSVPERKIERLDIEFLWTRSTLAVVTYFNPGNR